MGGWGVGRRGGQHSEENRIRVVVVVVVVVVVLGSVGDDHISY